jgi:hypothetical protein
MLTQRITALAYGILLVLVISRGGQEGGYYSYSTIYREQMEAFLAGRLALSDNVLAARHDLTWSEGGVHQVWGLGVPVWRLPWELAARAVGFAAFPDLFAVGLFGALAAYAVLSAFWGRAGENWDPTMPFLASSAAMSGSCRAASSWARALGAALAQA